MAFRLVRPLTELELDIAFACGARDEIDFVVKWTGRSRGETVYPRPEKSWSESDVRSWLKRAKGDVAAWLFEEVEETRDENG